MRSMMERVARARTRMQDTHDEDMRTRYEHAGPDYNDPTLAATRWLHIEQVPMRENVYVCVEVGGGGCAVLVQRPNMPAYEVDYDGAEALTRTSPLDEVLAIVGDAPWLARRVVQEWPMLGGTVQVKVYDPVLDATRTLAGVR